jgi:hypothetical protein
LDKRLKEICEEFGFRMEQHGLGIGWIGYYGTFSMIALGYNCYVVYNAETQLFYEVKDEDEVKKLLKDSIVYLKNKDVKKRLSSMEDDF